MPADASLNDAQIRVLQWIRDGCPDGVFTDGYSHRSSARALANRGLVKIKGHGPTWKAMVTEAGRTWKPGDIVKRKSTVSTQFRPRQVQSNKAKPAEPERNKAELMAATLLAQVLAAGGEIVLEPETDPEPYREAASASLGLEERPRGQCLTVDNVGTWSDKRYAVRTTEHFEDLVDKRPVPVGPDDARTHPVVRAYRGARDSQWVSKDHVARACVILQALVDEALRRQWTVDKGAVLDPARRRDSSGLETGHISFTLASGESYSVRIVEVPGKGATKYTWDLRPPRGLPGWMYTRGWEFIPTGRLELRINGVRRYGDSLRLRDSTKRTLDEQLPEVFYMIEVADLYEQRDRERREREHIEREARERAARVEAERRRRDQELWDRAVDDAKAWREVLLVREYLGQVDRAIAGGDVGDPEQLEAAVAGLRAQADARDPLRNL